MTERDLRQAKLAQLLAQGQKGMNIIAKSMVQPLREFQDYTSIGRAAFLVENLQQGQDPLLDTDVDGNVAYQVADLGQDILKIINPETMRIHTMEIAANPSISYEQLASRKYDVKARIEQKTRAEIFRVEDRCIFNSLSAAAFHEYERVTYQKDQHGNNPITLGGQKVTIAGNPVNAPIVTTASTVSIREISAAMAQIEKHGGLKATNLFMNPFNAQLLRNMNANNTNGYFIDFDTSAELMKTGNIGTVYGLQIFVTPELPVDKILVTAEPEYVGRIVTRIPLTVIPYDEPAARRASFSIFENIGILCHNAKAVCGIKISN